MRPKAKSVLVINLGWEQRHLLECLAKTGATLFGVHSDDDWPRDIPFASVLVADFRNLEKILDFAHAIKPQAVVCDQCDYSLFATALVAEELSLPGPGLIQAQLGQNKFLSRERARAANLRIPDFELCVGVDDATAAAERIGYPVIIKPVDNRGSFGVSFVQKRDQVRVAVSHAIVHSHSRMFLVERFIAGTNIILEGYFFPRSGYRTLALGSKTIFADRPQIHKEVVFPGELPTETYTKAIVENERVALGMGFRFGMTTAEYVVDESGDVWLVEIGNRGGGVLISSKITPAVSGIDHSLQLVYDSMGIDRDLFEEGPATQSAVCLSYIVLSPGRLTALEGVEDARVSDLLAMKYWGPRGGEIELPENALGRQGMIITTGVSVDSARSAADRIQSGIKASYAS